MAGSPVAHPIRRRTGRALSTRGRHFELVVIGASADGLLAIRGVLEHLPANLPAPLAIVLHHHVTKCV